MSMQKRATVRIISQKRTTSPDFQSESSTMTVNRNMYFKTLKTSSKKLTVLKAVQFPLNSMVICPSTNLIMKAMGSGVTFR